MPPAAKGGDPLWNPHRVFPTVAGLRAAFPLYLLPVVCLGEWRGGMQWFAWQVASPESSKKG